MQRITPGPLFPLYLSAATRRIEAHASAQLPPHTLMQRAGAACARLALALAPHAHCIWIACGSGNNGGDGLEAAAWLRRAGHRPIVTLLGAPTALPADAYQSWRRACAAGVEFADQPPELGPLDLCVDALLGLGLARETRAQPPAARLLDWIADMQRSSAPTLCVDLPSGLLADSGQWAPGFEHCAGAPRAPRHTLALLTLKPGLCTGHGRDAAGQLWWDRLAVDAAGTPPDAWLAGTPTLAPRAHTSHKGSFGDVAVLGGEGLAARGLGMTGAALLAADAALHAGAGRVLLALLDAGATTSLPSHPALMLRRPDTLALAHSTVVCGCGGGQAIAPLLPAVLDQAPRLVLDADALNALAADPALAQLLQARGAQPDRATVLTPHPLEAARLLGASVAQVQADRLGAAQQLAERYHAVVLLKGSGSIIAAPGQPPHINPTGNARLATAGSGDVLAGWIGARLAATDGAPHAALHAALHACWLHGNAADAWPAHLPLTAAALARAPLHP